MLKATRIFRRLVTICMLTVAATGMALLGPLVVGSFLHHDHMPGLLHDAILVCLLAPTLSDWSLLLLLALPVALLAGLVLTFVCSLGREWYRTHRLVRSLMEFRTTTEREAWDALLRRTGLEGRVDYVTLDRQIAFCYGWIRPRVCVTRGMLAHLNEREIEALLLHERHHMLQFDPLKTALARTFSKIFFFLPVVHALHEQYIVAREIEADEFVLHRQRTDEALVSALCKTLSRSKGDPRSMYVSTATVATAGYGDRLNQRIDYLLSGTRPRCYILSSSILLRSTIVAGAIAFLVAVSTSSAVANGLWHQAHRTLVSCPLMH